MAWIREEDALKVKEACGGNGELVCIEHSGECECCPGNASLPGFEPHCIFGFECVNMPSAGHESKIRVGEMNLYDAAYICDRMGRTCKDCVANSRKKLSFAPRCAFGFRADSLPAQLDFEMPTKEVEQLLYG